MLYILLRRIHDQELQKFKLFIYRKVKNVRKSFVQNDFNCQLLILYRRDKKFPNNTLLNSNKYFEDKNDRWEV